MKVLIFDIESHNAGRHWDMEPREFVRLFQYAWGRDGDVQLTTDYDEMIDLIRSADRVVGHNILGFDLRALFGKDSMEPLEMAYNRRVVDTMVLANLVYPPPAMYTNRAGRQVFDAAKPERALSFLSLDNLCFQLGVDGKFGNLAEIAARYNPPKTPRKELDFGLIPLDDEEFLGYAVQDIVALQGLAGKLLDLSGGVMTDYMWREMVSVAIDNQISANGFRVDVPVAEARVEELRVRREEIMNWLVEEFDMPTDSKMPWKSNAGKGAILKALDLYGIHPEGNSGWARTAGGAPSFGGEVLKEVTEGTEAEELGQALAELQGQRSLAQLALDSVYEDGFAHPDITSLQRTGRKSFTRPGLSIWTARGPGAVEKRYFVADAPDHRIVEVDYSQIDARCVAALAGDVEFAKRFAPGVDAHELSGRLAFGDEVYDSDPETYRQMAKVGTHGWNYNIGIRKLASSLGISEAVAKSFIEGLNKAYPRVAAWKARMADLGDSGWIVNAHGRRMRVDRDRSWSQSSGLVGQSSATELLKGALIRLYERDPSILRMVKATIHDAIVFSIPLDRMDEVCQTIRECFEAKWQPPGGMGVEFPVAFGPLDASNWFLAGH